jgi:hypothetical protein
VLLIGGLLMSFVLPSLSALSSRVVRREAELIVATIDMARQRSVMTALPHRLWLDIDTGTYRLEWLQSEAADTEATSEEAAPGSDAPTLSLAPPPRAETAYEPVPGYFGKLQELAIDVEFEGVETPGGWVDLGDATISFERDGTSSFTTIVLAGADGQRLSLEILPLADTVRVVDEAI